MIATHYMSEWLIWDVLASIPISFFEVAQFSNPSAQRLSTLGTLKILKIVRFRRWLATPDSSELVESGILILTFALAFSSKLPTVRLSRIFKYVQRFHISTTTQLVVLFVYVNFICVASSFFVWRSTKTRPNLLRARAANC